MLGIPQDITECLCCRLAQRTTTLHFDGFMSAIFGVDNGLDQGDPLSVILYIIYNTPLLNISLPARRAAMLLFVDNAAIITTGATFSTTHTLLADIMEKDGGVLDWARLHNCSFGIEKFQLLDTGRRHGDIRVPLVLGQQSIPSRPSAKFLGVTVDNQLQWKEQGAAALRKGQAWVGQICRLSQTTKGVSRAHMRQLSPPLSSSFSHG